MTIKMGGKIKLTPDRVLLYYYDRSLRLWVSIIQDADGEQISKEAYYHVDKEVCIALIAYFYGVDSTK